MQTQKTEQGQGLVEYALILVLIAIVIILILTVLGDQVNLVYARVMAGLNGQVITGVGTEYVVTGFDLDVTGSPPICNVSVSGATVIALQDGEIMADSPISVPVLVNGNPTGSLTGTTNGNGVATTTNTVTTSASCPGSVNVGGRSQSFGN